MSVSDPEWQEAMTAAREQIEIARLMLPELVSLRGQFAQESRETRVASVILAIQGMGQDDLLLLLAVAVEALVDREWAFA